MQEIMKYKFANKNNEISMNLPELGGGTGARRLGTGGAGRLGKLSAWEAIVGSAMLAPAENQKFKIAQTYFKSSQSPKTAGLVDRRRLKESEYRFIPRNAICTEEIIKKLIKFIVNMLQELIHCTPFHDTSFATVLANVRQCKRHRNSLVERKTIYMCACNVYLVGRS